VSRLAATLLAGLALTACTAAPTPAPSPGGSSTAATRSTNATAPGPTAPTTPSPTTPTGTLAAPASPSQPTTGADWRTGPRVAGLDVSAYQSTVDWAGLWAGGHRFVWVKATEGTSYTNPRYAAQRTGARAVGMLQGGYHYARPNASTGSEQARYFLANGGGWSADGATLPGVLDLERNDSGEACYGLSMGQLSAWVGEFSTTYRQATGRAPVIYVRADMWAQCLGGDRSFGATNPLWLYDHEGEVGPWPAGWSRPTVWQRGVEDNLDRNVFFGTEAELRRWASTP